VLVGKERFSENHTWSEMPLHWSSDVADRAVIEAVGQGGLEARLVDADDSATPSPATSIISHPPDS
jgi:hypothetical protein